MSLRGSTLRDSRVLARPSAFDDFSFTKREKKDLGFVSEEKLVYTFVAEETIGDKRRDIWLTSPLWTLVSLL